MIVGFSEIPPYSHWDTISTNEGVLGPVNSKSMGGPTSNHLARKDGLVLIDSKTDNVGI